MPDTVPDTDNEDKQLPAVREPAASEDSEEDPHEVRMSFTEHLGELRTRLIRSGIAILVATVICYIFSNQIFTVIARPLSSAGIFQDIMLDWAGPPTQPEEVVVVEDPLALRSPALTRVEGFDALGDTAPVLRAIAEDLERLSQQLSRVEERVLASEPEDPDTVQWTILNPLESIIVQIKLAIYFGFLFALPVVVWQGCAFVFPGLRPNERRVVRVLIFGCSLLASAGVLIAYFLVFPLVLPYLLQWVPEGVVIQLRMSETVSIIIMGLVGFAIAFQFPMAVLILVYLDLIQPADLKKYRKLAIVGIAGVSAILTPAEPVSMIIMMIPLLLLYELSILVSYLVIRRRRSTA